MKKSNFYLALSLISETHSNTIIINHVKPNGSVGELTRGKPSISIISCCEGTINRLKENGFGLGMVEGMLVLNDRNVI